MFVKVYILFVARFSNHVVDKTADVMFISTFNVIIHLGTHLVTLSKFTGPTI